MKRAFLFLFILLLQMSADGKPIWNPPVFLQAPSGWVLRKEKSDDSQVFSLTKGAMLLKFDYGAHAIKSKTWCAISDLAEISVLEDLKCIASTKQHNKIRRLISIKDAQDEARMGLLIFADSGYADKDERELIALLKSLQFVGKLENLKLVSINSRQRQARVMDESGIKRTVKKNDLIAKNFARVREINNDHLLIEEYLLEDEGFKPYLVKLYLSR